MNKKEFILMVYVLLLTLILLAPSGVVGVDLRDMFDRNLETSVSLEPFEYMYGIFSVGCGDVDLDGDVDILVGYLGIIRLFLCDENGTHHYCEEYSFNELIEIGEGDIELADFNNDGRLDIIAGGGSQGQVVILLNNYTEESSGPFFEEYGVVHRYGQCAYGVAVADFNGDGWLDFVSGGALNPYPLGERFPIDIFYNNCTNGVEFTRHSAVIPYVDEYCDIVYYNDFEVADFDDDEDIDILFTHNEFHNADGLRFNVRSHADILWNDGDDSFSGQTQIRSKGLPSYLNYKWVTIAFRAMVELIRPCAVFDRINPDAGSGDFDLDGDIDIVMTDHSGIVEYYENDGSGNFSQPGLFHQGVIFDMPGRSWSVTPYDSDDDGDLDIFTYCTVFTNMYAGSGYNLLLIKENYLID